MKLRLDLVSVRRPVATAGSELVAPDALSAEPGREQERLPRLTSGATRAEATERILAEGY